MSEACRIIARACALLIFLILSLFNETIKSPTFKQLQTGIWETERM